MDRSDGGLAPVIYLPGVQAPADRSEHPSSHVPAAHASAAPAPGAHTPAPARPTFAAIYDDESLPQPLDDLHDDSDTHEAPDRDAELARAENVSMHALTRRGQSRRELERTLRSRDFADDVITHEVERLERVGLIDDVALAQNLVGVLQERKGLGRTGIAAELTRRLLSPAAIEYALELIDTADELSRAREIAVKRAGQLSSYDPATAKRRLGAYLQRRGYSGSVLSAAMNAALSSRDSGGVRFR